MTEANSRTVVVTGASRGIGRAICLAMADADTRIYFNYYSPADPEAEAAAAAETEAQVAEAGGSVTGICANVADRDQITAFFDRVMQEAGRVDVLVNNAGITRDTLLLRMDEKQWRSVIDVNLTSVFLCTKAVVKHMAKARYGRIINISSVVGLIGNPGQANYASAKAGMLGLTKTVAKEMASRNITANALAPGFIATAMTEELSDKAKEAFLQNIPLGRAGQPQDVANAALFLASEAASYITGQVLNIDGGLVM